jgi:hypothetical protein
MLRTVCAPSTTFEGFELNIDFSPPGQVSAWPVS